MDKLLFFFVIVTLGSVLGGVRRHSTESPESADTFLDDLQKQAEELSSTYDQYFRGIFNPAAESSGSQAEQIPVDTILTNLMQNLRNNQSFNIDLTQAMQNINASHNLPFDASDSVANVDDSEFLDHINKQVSSFNKIIDTDLTQALRPEHVQGYMNILKNMFDPSIANGENKAAIGDLQDQANALDAEYYRAFSEALKQRETSQSEEAGSSPSLEDLQKHVTDFGSKYNSELTQALRPNAIRNINMHELTNNMGQAVSNIFQKIAQSPIRSKTT